jgi:Recombination endonuclease VII
VQEGGSEHVDHDHQTGQVRGILCFNCNQALGNVHDDPAVLVQLITYLQRPPGLGRRLITDEHLPPRGVIVELTDELLRGYAS